MRNGPLEIDHGVIERILLRVACSAHCRSREDLAQELRLFLLVRGPSLLERSSERSTFETYLANVLRKQAVNYWRHHERNTSRLTNVEAAERLADPHDDISERVQREERARMETAAHLALSTLAANDRRFFVRVAQHGQPMLDIAREFGITRDAAYSRYHRLLRKVRRTAAEALKADPIRSSDAVNREAITAPALSGVRAMGVWQGMVSDPRTRKSLPRPVGRLA